MYVLIEQEWKLRWFLCIGTHTYYYAAADANLSSTETTSTLRFYIRVLAISKTYASFLLPWQLKLDAIFQTFCNLGEKWA